MNTRVVYIDVPKLGSRDARLHAACDARGKSGQNKGIMNERALRLDVYYVTAARGAVALGKEQPGRIERRAF